MRARCGGAAALMAACLLGCGGGGASDEGDLTADAVGLDAAEVDAGSDSGGDAASDALTLSAPWGRCEPASEAFPVRPAPALQPTLPPLRVQGAQVVDGSGSPVALRGVNFGSWLLIESWISGIGLQSEGALLDALEARAAAAGLAELLLSAREANGLEWLAEQRSHLPLIREWFESMRAEATPAQRPAVEELVAWFEAEPWIYEEQGLWDWLEGRFGAQVTAGLRATYQDHYITEVDVERVAAMGLNLIRVPIWFDQLESDRQGDVHFRPEGFERLDRLAGWARAHAVYLMLDLHGAPGGQSPYWHQGLSDGGALWTEPACLARTERLWEALASYFAGDPHVAVYDLLNEPRAPDAAAYRAVHQALYAAARRGDPDTIVMIEDGYLPRSWVPAPAAMDMENAMLSIHLYPTSPSADAYVDAMDEALGDDREWLLAAGAPVYLGEFNPADDAVMASWPPEALDRTLALLNARGIHWGIWTWKYHDDDPLWGVYHPPGDAAGHRVDVRSASAETIRADFEAMDSATWVSDPAWYGAFTDHAADPVMPLDP
ncbi:MAG: cellulase family glycosylhydrolase [Deltaproteobacteria bacterium]|nr:cellulase family glycosylhydrolase [Deltaproteobacteria bacterium]MCB9785393.1 cellulase family glycosylhydrolase [Deltaproteobacteria bacterium]